MVSPMIIQIANCHIHCLLPSKTNNLGKLALSILLKIAVPKIGFSVTPRRSKNKEK